MWVDIIEDSALEQAKNLANLPFIHKHVALMPDAHQGYGMPIGGVIATKGVVIPNAVGVDIGCGMCAVKTSIEDIDSATLKKLMSLIRKKIPLGKNWHKQPQDSELMPKVDQLPTVVSRQYNRALYQLGTLGGGNHFIEIQYGSDNSIWIMIHSGSRNIGLKVANHYNELAKKLNEKWYSEIPAKWDLAFLPIETPEAKEYMEEMNYCVEFALANRNLMMERIKECFRSVFGQKIEFDNPINIAHNYACWEHHFNEDVLVHRKGATCAKEGTLGIIPGSQGTKSFITQGLGNPDSFDSCSHGAGRVLGRKQAIRSLDLAQEIELLNKKGIIHSVRNQNDLDEAPSAYKNIEQVMANQTDLVKIKVALEPLAVIKG